jgi:type VI secretion system protein ImpG
VPDAHSRVTTEIFSIDDVVAVAPDTGESQRFEPLYSHRHGVNGQGRSFWMAKRRFSSWRSDVGTDVVLSFVDLTGRVVYPDFEVVTARVTCFNSDLPSRLPFGNERGDFELDRGGPVRAIVALVKPTRVVQPPLGSPQVWRLISQLSLNYLSLTDTDAAPDGEDETSRGTEALREVLRLHDFSGEPAVRKQIDGVKHVGSAPAFARIATEHGLSFARGRRVELELDEEQFTGAGAYLFASVLDRFFGLYSSINSFSTLAARSRQRKGGIREWPPRAGWKPLL